MAGAALIAGNAAVAQTELAGDAAARIARAVKSTGVRDAPYDFYTRAPYRADVPKPDAILGYPLGTWHSTFRDQERVLLAIAAAAPDRVRLWEYGKSVEGRPLRLLAISSPANITRLDAIRAANLRLADGRDLSPTDAETIMKTAPALVWINECIHGGETASFETAMATVYTLAASDSPGMNAARDSTVVLLNPVFNPDGHERFVVSLNATATGSADRWAFENETPWIAQGRFNHNRFDMNRDKVAQSQPETRQETREFLRWLPQVFADQHGEPEVYFFPPNAQATNPNVDPARVARWTQTFGHANGRVFDAHGWPFVSRETYDFFYPGYLDSFTTLCGAIGMTYETDGGGNLVTRKSDGSLTTLRDATAHHFETALATVQTASSNREALLRDFTAYRRSALAQSGRVLISATRDPGRARELASLLLRLGVEVRELIAPFTLKATTYEASAITAARTFPIGSLVIDYAQPQGHLAKALLERDTTVEPEFAKVQAAKRKCNDTRNTNEPTEEYEFYDTTAWSLPLLYGLDATADAPPIAPTGTRSLTLDADAVSVSPTLAGGGIAGDVGPAAAFAIPFTTDNAVMLALRLAQSGFRLTVTQKAVTVNRKSYPAGTLFLRPSRNPADLAPRLDALAKSLGVAVEAIPNTGGGSGANDAGLGSQHISPVAAPRVAVVTGDGINQTSYGSVSFTLAQSGVAFTLVAIHFLKNAEARAAFTVLILPEGNYRRDLKKEDIAALKEWASDGRCLIGLGSGAKWLTTKDADWSSVRPVGERTGGKVGEKASDKTDEKSKEKPESPVSLPGAIFRATVRADHFLGWGYGGGTIPVPLSGDTFWRKSDTGANVVTFAAKSPSRLSGFVWDDNTEKLLAGTAYVVDEPTGSGHLILFLNDPTERYMSLGLRRMFLSAVLFGGSKP